jgi:hypothetical protein
MDVVLIFNGLGNQMSQYALYLKKKQLSRSARFLFLRKSARVHNGYELEKVFGIPQKTGLFNDLLYYLYLALAYQKKFARPLLQLLRRLGFAVIREGDNYNFQPHILTRAPVLRFYVGGWHSDGYFRDIRPVILDAFRFDTASLGQANLDMLERIKGCNSVSVHVRRGDYLDSQNFHKLGAVCTFNYYVTAIDRMRSLVGNPHFFFFTNDHAWVREHFNGDQFTVVDLNSGSDSWKDMFLMSRCMHNIGSNGSFSWWASWLNPNPKKTVIFPYYFMAGLHFEDIYPESWIRLSDY